MKQINNILIIDDNPFPTREACKVLIEKFSKYSFVSDNNVLLESFERIYSSQYKDLVTDFPIIRGKELYLQFAENLTLTIYNYDPIRHQSDNQNNILRILKDNNINIFWCDRGHSPFEIKGASMYKLDYGYNAKSDILFENRDIVNQLITNNLKQVAVYTYNPELTEREAENRKDIIIEKFESKLKINDIYVIETSSVFNIFNGNDSLSSGSKEDKFLGTLKAYELYGKLLGSILFDLFLQLNENKLKLSRSQNRYNFFNANNREILGYFKLLNSNNIDIIPFIDPNKVPNKDTNTNHGFNLGLISFYGDIFGEEYFLIDAPYKEYYEQYDHLLQNPPEKINSIFNISTEDNRLNTDSKDLKERWMYYKYKRINKDFVFCHKIHEDLNGKEHLTEKYLPLLHTAIFYEPYFYEDIFPFNRFYKCDSKTICFQDDIDAIEILYYYKKIILKSIVGYIHFAVWRKGGQNIINFEKLIDGIWDNYYKLIEPKIKETLINVSINEIHKQATNAAVSQVMARNMSHNIGSHVLNKLVNEKYLRNFIKGRVKKINYYADEIDLSTSYDQIAKFNNYIRCRIDYLSDMSFSVPIMQTTKKAYSDIYKGIDRVLLLLENITGLSNFKYSITFEKIVGGEVIKLTEQNDYSLAIPNDVLGCQALYNIIENIIRNTAKHRIDKEKPKTVFTVRIREIDFDESILNDTHLTKEYQEHCCIEIFDDIDLTDVCEHESDGKLIPYIKWLCKAQNKIINDPILDLNNKLRASSLGLIEMEASAAYLRQLEVNLIDDPEYKVLNNLDYFNASKKLDILKAVIIENNSEKYLGYRIFIKKPQEVLIVTDNQQIISADKKSELHRDGVWIVSIKEFTTHIHENKRVYNHQFVIHDGLEDVTISTLA